MKNTIKVVISDTVPLILYREIEQKYYVTKHSLSDAQKVIEELEEVINELQEDLQNADS